MEIKNEHLVGFVVGLGSGRGGEQAGERRGQQHHRRQRGAPEGAARGRNRRPERWPAPCTNGGGRHRRTAPGKPGRTGAGPAAGGPIEPLNRKRGRPRAGRR